ncbi:membrane-spanning 4-domains subfamily A member 8-like [Lontra canadensis]|uniref:membrane-spanning 4-domains subfamily A member 8-like n=1 Tax=Lontra canadensis TaxID=76717 RepID=UPI0013F36C90|nr:membrane-spanning 4-domains subfamily A member 8-like [Lontra canadensis]
MLGAAQVMIGLIHCVLGYFWIYLYVREFDSVSINYLPLTLMSGYPFGAFLIFIISGIFAVEAEKTRSPKLLRCTIRANTYSSTLAMIGLFLIGFEITFFLVKREKIVWIQVHDTRECFYYMLKNRTIMASAQNEKFNGK